MSTKLVSIRIDPQLQAELVAAAQRESARRGRRITWARLLREGGKMMLRKLAADQQKP